MPGSGLSVSQAEPSMLGPGAARSTGGETPSSCGPLAHLDNGGNTEEQTHLPNETHLSGPIDSPPTEVRLASVAAHKPAARASSGKRTSTTTSKSNRRCHKGAKGDGIEAHGPLPSLPHPIVPSHQAMPSPHLRRSSYLAHRSQRTRRRGDGGPIDLDSDLRRLTPQEGDFGLRRLQDKQQILVDTLKQLKVIEEELAQRGKHASLRVSESNTADCASAPQHSLTMGSAQNGASNNPWTRLRHFSTTAVYPTFSERQRHGGFLPAQGFVSQYGQPGHSSMASLIPPTVQDRRPLDIRSMDVQSAPPPGPPSHNVRAFVEVEMEATPIQPAPRRQAHAHATVDGGIVTATSSSTFHGNPAPPFYPGQAGFGGQGDVVRAGTLPVCSVSELATVQPASTRRGRLGEILGAEALEAECFFDEARAIPCDASVVTLGLELQPAGYEGTYDVPLPSHASHPPVTFEPPWDSLSSTSLPTSIPYSRSIIAPFEGPRMRWVPLTSIADGTVLRDTDFGVCTHRQ
ncbi:hypothetical protein VTO73DRAFT_8580 [Trametes versicolor]